MTGDVGRYFGYSVLFLKMSGFLLFYLLFLENDKQLKNGFIFFFLKRLFYHSSCQVAW